MDNNIEEPIVDFMKVEWQRGRTPDGIKDICFQLCADYLGGVWSQVSIDDIHVKRLSGGLTNQLYYCALNEDLRNSDTTEPQEVVLRLYEAKHFNNMDNEGNERLSDTIISVLVSEYNLGPKIYGLFESGQILKYYKVLYNCMIFLFDCHLFSNFIQSISPLDLTNKMMPNWSTNWPKG